MADQEHNPPKPPIAIHRRQSDEPRRGFDAYALAGITFFSTLLLWVSFPSLFPLGAEAVMVKTTLLALAGGLVSYAINRIAIERGAPLAVLGYPFAGFISVIGILTIGVSLFAVTYAGLVLPDVARLKLQAHLSERTEHVAALNAEAAAFNQAASAVGATASDLADKATCELASSCISGVGAGGNGPVYRATVAVAGRALSVDVELSAAERSRREVLARLNADLEAFRDDLAGGEGSIWERYQSLQVIDARLLQAGEELVRAMPVALLASYAVELGNGVTIADRAEASQTLSRVMRGHGAALAQALEPVAEMQEGRPVAASFPVRPGVGDTFAYIAHFWPVAMIAFIVELVLPISLWLYTLLNLAWLADRDLPRRKRPVARPRPFAALIDDSGAGTHAGTRDAPIMGDDDSEAEGARAFDKPANRANGSADQHERRLRSSGHRANGRRPPPG